MTYKVTKAGMIAFTQQLALQNAPYGIRANCILPGLMDTPMAVDTRARASNRSRAEVAAERDAKVPLRGKMGTGWDVANAALFLASDEANFITGVALAGGWRRAGQNRLIEVADAAGFAVGTIGRYAARTDRAIRVKFYASVICFTPYWRGCRYCSASNRADAAWSC